MNGTPDYLGVFSSKRGFSARLTLDIPLDTQILKWLETWLVVQIIILMMVVSAPNKTKSWCCNVEDHVMEAIT